MTYEERSKARNRRAGGTGSYAGDSAAREERIDKKQDFGDTHPGKFVPFGVREAQWRKQGYRGKDAKRMAQFQSSTAGQAMGAGGTLEDPYGGFDTQNQERERLLPDPVTPEGSGQQGEINPATNPFLDPKWAGADPNSPQANFLKRRQQRELDEGEIKRASYFAEKMGTTFDPEKGYSREPFQSTRGKFYDPIAETIKGKKSPSESTLPAPSEDDIEASFQMPDGTMRNIRANETVEDGFKRARTARPEKESTEPEAEPSTRKTSGMRNIAAFSPESAAQENPMLREQAIRGKVSPVEPKAQKPDAGGKVSITQDNPKSDSVKADKNESTDKKRSPKDWQKEFDSVTKEISDFAKENAQGRDRVSLLFQDLTEDKYARNSRSEDEKDAMDHIHRITGRMSEAAKKSDERLKKEQDKLKSMRVDLSSGRWGFRMKQINQQLERNKAMRRKVAEIRTRYKKEQYPEFNPNL